jgi:hypothetical protein
MSVVFWGLLNCSAGTDAPNFATPTPPGKNIIEVYALF